MCIIKPIIKCAGSYRRPVNGLKVIPCDNPFLITKKKFTEKISIRKYTRPQNYSGGLVIIFNYLPATVKN